MPASAAASAAYVVLSHRHPDQVERLVRRILELSPDAAVLVRHDARAAAAPVLASARVRVEAHTDASDWGSWDLVRATLGAMHRAAEMFDPAMLVLVSGQDYPCRDLARWERDFGAAGGGWACAYLHPLHYRPRWGRGYGAGDDTLTRYLYRWYPLPGGRWLHRSGSRVAAALRWLLVRAGHYLEPVLCVRNVTRGRGYHVGLRALRTPFGAGTPCQMGSQWLAMDRGALAEVERALSGDRVLRRTYRRAIIPDESFVQTVLARRGPPLEGFSVSHSVWQAERDAPRTLTLGDLDGVLASGAAFCRKLEPGASDTLADELDRIAAGR
ncbi:MAG TPA: hypothetical protein VGC04_07900 [Cellulomonas sp.]